MSPRMSCKIRTFVKKITMKKEVQKAIDEKRKRNFLEILSCLFHCECYAEYRFYDKRRWRFDFAIPSRKIAIEIEGGVWTNGRHTRGKGYIGDMEKYNFAALLGWRILRFTPQQQFSEATFLIIGKMAV